MEWVETTGRTIEAAKDAALDQLGVDEEDAEFEVLEEAKLGLFGRLRSEARVRARVRPTTPRPKDDRRDRSRRRRAAEGSAGGAAKTSDREASSRSPDAGGAKERQRGSADRDAAVEATGTDGGRAKPRHRGGRRRSGQPTGREAGRDTELDGAGRAGEAVNRVRDGGSGMDVSLEEQGTVARVFLDGLVREMSLEADIEVVQPDEDTVEVNLEGPDLGLLIGPKGATLFALQDLTRTVVQRKTSASNGRLLIDVSGYRQKRKSALERFARQLAEEVRSSGTRKVLEPMNAADRKIVHDAVNDIDGVATTSEGEDPQRRVVILPAES